MKLEKRKVDSEKKKNKNKTKTKIFSSGMLMSVK